MNVYGPASGAYVAPFGKFIVENLLSTCRLYYFLPFTGVFPSQNCEVEYLTSAFHLPLGTTPERFMDYNFALAYALPRERHSGRYICHYFWRNQFGPK